MRNYQHPLTILSREVDTNQREDYEPYVELLTAVVHQALYDLTNDRHAPLIVKYRTMAYLWFTDTNPRNERVPFTFTWICRALSMNAGAIRKQVEKWWFVHERRRAL